MIIEDRLGPATLRGFPDGVYLLTDSASWPLVDHPHLLDRLVRECARYLGSATEDAARGSSFTGTLVPSADGGVNFVADGEVHGLADDRELVARLVAICRRALVTAHPADAWEVD